MIILNLRVHSSQEIRTVDGEIYFTGVNPEELEKIIEKYQLRLIELKRNDNKTYEVHFTDNTNITKQIIFKDKEKFQIRLGNLEVYDILLKDDTFSFQVDYYRTIDSLMNKFKSYFIGQIKEYKDMIDNKLKEKEREREERRQLRGYTNKIF